MGHAADGWQSCTYVPTPLISRGLSGFPLCAPVFRLYCPPPSRGLYSQDVCFYTCHWKLKPICSNPSKLVWKSLLITELSSWVPEISICPRGMRPGFAFDRRSRSSCVFPDGTPPALSCSWFSPHHSFILQIRWTVPDSGHDSLQLLPVTSGCCRGCLGRVHSVQD